MLKPIPSFPNYYVASEGKVLKRLPNGKLEAVKYHVVKQYKKVYMINNRGRKVEFPIHKLVAEGFCKGRKQGYEAHHINRNRHDCRAENLVWMSPVAHDLLHAQLRAAGK